MDFNQFYNCVGGSYQDALKRLMNDVLLKKFILKFKDDPSFNNLKQALLTNDLEVAFREVHTLKGVAYNMAFNNLGDASSVLTETLRTDDKYSVDKNLITEQFKLIELQYENVIHNINIYFV